MNPEFFSLEQVSVTIDEEGFIVLSDDEAEWAMTPDEWDEMVEFIEAQRADRRGQMS